MLWARTAPSIQAHANTDIKSCPARLAKLECSSFQMLSRYAESVWWWLRLMIGLCACSLRDTGDKTVKLWSLADQTCLRTFEGHTGSVLRASFATSGTQVGARSNERGRHLPNIASLVYVVY